MNREYLKAFLIFGAILGVTGFAQTLVATGEVLLAAGALLGIVVLSITAGLIKYAVDSRRGRVEELTRAQREAPGIGSFLLRVASPTTLAFYAAIASVIAGAAGSPGFVPAFLLVGAVVLFAVGRRRDGGSREARS